MHVLCCMHACMHACAVIILLCLPVRYASLSCCCFSFASRQANFGSDDEGRALCQRRRDKGSPFVASTLSIALMLLPAVCFWHHCHLVTSDLFFALCKLCIIRFGQGKCKEKGRGAVPTMVRQRLSFSFQQFVYRFCVVASRLFIASLPFQYD